MRNLTISYEKGDWKYQLKTNFDNSSIGSPKELADILAKIIMEADMHPQHVLAKLREIFPNENYKDNK